MRTLVMGDIHGAYKALKQCLERAAFDYEKDTLIQLGDVTDRYDQVYDVVEELIKIKNLVAIRGNHDAWLLDFITTGLHPAFWRLGGNYTARSYLQLTGRQNRIIQTGQGFKTALEVTDIPSTHRAFFANQRNYYIDTANNCYVHGGFNRLLPFHEQRETEFYRNRTLWQEALALKENYQGNAVPKFEMMDSFHQIFLGHTPTTTWGSHLPMHIQNIWNLDTGCGNGVRLTIMDAATNQYWQSDLVMGLYGG